MAVDVPAGQSLYLLSSPVNEVFAARVREDQSEGLIAADIDPELAAKMITALSDGLQVQWLLDDSVDMGSIVETFWSLLKRVR